MTRSLPARAISIRTSNHYLAGAKQFTRWATLGGLLSRDPLIGIQRLNARAVARPRWVLDAARIPGPRRDRRWMCFGAGRSHFLLNGTFWGPLWGPPKFPAGSPKRALGGGARWSKSGFSGPPGAKWGCSAGELRKRPTPDSTPALIAGRGPDQDPGAKSVFQRAGSSSWMREAGCVATRVSTSVK